MRTLTWSLVVAAGVASAAAETTLLEVSWRQVAAQGLPPLARVVDAVPGGRCPCLQVTAGDGGPHVVTLVEVAPPGITEERWAFIGRLRYRDVEGEGYLEMWSELEGGGRYFSRTLGGSGAMGALSGSASWRPVVVPFTSREGAGAPRRLELNLVLPGKGTVILDRLRLVQLAPGEGDFPLEGAWWSGTTAGIVGGVLGTVLGLAGALIGWMASAGKRPTLAFKLCWAVLVVGVVLLLAGGTALALGQPFQVAYGLLLTGGIAVVVPASVMPALRRRREEAELRRMRAADLG